MIRPLFVAGTLAFCAACGSVKSNTDGAPDSAADHAADVSTDAGEDHSPAVDAAGDAAAPTDARQDGTPAADAGQDATPVPDAGQDAAPPSPSKLAEDLAANYREVVVVGTNVVFSSDSNIFRTPVSGGIVSPIVAVGSTESIIGLQADTSYVYFLVQKIVDGGQVWTLNKAPLGGGTAAPVVSADCGLRLAGNATDLFFTRGDHKTISRVSKDGSGLLTVATAASEVRGIAADSNNVYFTTMDEVRQVPVAGGTTKLLFSQSSGGFDTIFSDGTTVYFARYGEVRRVPVGGGTVSLMMAPASSTYVAGIATNSTYLFVLAGQTSAGGCGGVGLWRMPLSGGVAQSVPMGHPGTCPQDLFLASDAAYLTTLVSSTGYSGELWKVPL